MAPDSSYRALGASATKEEVLAAASIQGDGLYPGAFCKLLPDVLGGSSDHCVALHTDGAGTKSIVAYLAYRESGDARCFASLAQDALVMNVDDLLCVGSTGPFLVANTIGRHRDLVPGAAVEAIVAGYQAVAEMLEAQGIEVLLSGGETADVGDLVRTVIVDASVACRMARRNVIDGSRLAPSDVIVGLGSAGRARYETEENSGIGSNGLTLARHVLLSSSYRERYPEARAPELEEGVSYRGAFHLDDRPDGLGMTVGEALLSPTRSYAPIISRVLAEMPSAVHAIVHCTGGGQTKCLRLPGAVSFDKDDLFAPPPIFELVREAGEMSWSELYQVFNMGHRMELFVEASAAGEVVALAREHDVDAAVVGRCGPPREGPRLRVESPGGALEYG